MDQYALVPKGSDYERLFVEMICWNSSKPCADRCVCVCVCAQGFGDLSSDGTSTTPYCVTTGCEVASKQVYPETWYPHFRTSVFCEGVWLRGSVRAAVGAVA
jgi:hypothetical protein